MSIKKRPIGNHEADISNPNKGTDGSNISWDQAQGNKGKQKNPNQHGATGYSSARVSIIHESNNLLIGPDKIIVKDISIVIPVKDNQQGVNNFLNGFFLTHHCKIYPKEIIFVDNNSRVPLEIPMHFQSNHLKIKKIVCTKIGPAAARNKGALASKGSWILFTDSDCIPTEEMLTGYVQAANGTIAFAGQIKSFQNNPIARYYDSQQIFKPPLMKGFNSPQYLITANTLVWKYAFKHIGGFNETYPLAGGEDVDLGIRLNQVGKTSFAPYSIVLHNIESGLWPFLQRFYRYGAGNRMVGKQLGIDMKPKLFSPFESSILNRTLAFFQYVGLKTGYIIN